MSPQADLVIRAALDRCDAEIAAIAARPDVVAGQAPAYLVTMGVSDWNLERRAILDEAPPARWPYVWRWKSRLPDRQGWPCRVVTRGNRNSALVAFPDGFQAVTSRNALRRRTLFPMHDGDDQGSGRECQSGELRGIRTMYLLAGAHGEPCAGLAKRSAAPRHH